MSEHLIFLVLGVVVGFTSSYIQRQREHARRMARLERTLAGQRPRTYTGPWLVGQRAEYTDESLPGVVLHTYNDGVNKVVFAPDRGGAFHCSDDHLAGETSGAEGCQP